MNKNNLFKKLESISNISKKNKMIIAGILTTGVLVVGGTTIVRYETYNDLMAKCKENGVEDKYGDVGLFIKKSTLELIEEDLNNQIQEFEKTYSDLEKIANEYGLDITTILGDEKVRANQITLLAEAIKSEEENRSKVAQQQEEQKQAEQVSNEIAMEQSNNTSNGSSTSYKPSNGGGSNNANNNNSGGSSGGGGSNAGGCTASNGRPGQPNTYGYCISNEETEFLQKRIAYEEEGCNQKTFGSIEEANEWGYNNSGNGYNSYRPTYCKSGSLSLEFYANDESNSKFAGGRIIPYNEAEYHALLNVPYYGPYR